MIDDENVASQSGSAKVVKGEIVAVIAVDMYKVCCNCNAKMVDGNGPVGVCSKCSTKMKLLYLPSVSLCDTMYSKDRH